MSALESAVLDFTTAIHSFELALKTGNTKE